MCIRDRSYVGSILATFALGACAGYGWQGMLLPMALAVCGIICSIIGSFLVKTKEDATQKSLLTSLRTGTYTAAILSAIVAAPLCYFILGPENNCWGIFIAILCGLIGGTLIGYFTEYFTSDNYKQMCIRDSSSPLPGAGIEGKKSPEFPLCNSALFRQFLPLFFVVFVKFI